MRIKLMIMAVVLQVLVLVYMAGEREWIVRNGTIVYLQTAPLDPRDPFRGNYVKLDYAMNHVPTNRLRGVSFIKRAEHEQQSLRGKQVYAVLRNSGGVISSLDYVTDQKPDDGLFIRGRIDRYWYWGGGEDVIPVRYGFEAFFMQEDKARALEGQRRRDGIQVPLEMEVAVSGKGVSVLKGYRWSTLGIGMKLEMVSPTNRQVRAATIQLVNVSSNDVAIIDLPDAQSMALENDWIRSWGNRDVSWVMAGKPRAQATDDHVVVLKPGGQHEIHVDLTQPHWFVSKGNEQAKSLRDLQGGSMFRLIYRPPDPGECQGLKRASLIWHGELPSPAFGGGRVD